MIQFAICLAEVVIEVCAFYESTKEYCKDYLTDAPADFLVCIETSDIDYERTRSDSKREVANQTTGSEGIRQRNVPEYVSDAYLETLALYRKIADRLVAYDTLLFHGSVVAVDGAAYLFTAKSGTGKSTHTALWREYFGDRAVMVNDDKPLLKVTEQRVYVCGTPWAGKEKLQNNIIVPLNAVCILTRDTANHIEKIDKKDAWSMILQQSYRSAQKEILARTISLADRMMNKVNIYKLGCNRSAEAVKTAYIGMKQGEYDEIKR